MLDLETFAERFEVPDEVVWQVIQVFTNLPVRFPALGNSKNGDHTFRLVDLVDDAVSPTRIRLAFPPLS